MCSSKKKTLYMWNLLILSFDESFADFGKLLARADFGKSYKSKEPKRLTLHICFNKKKLHVYIRMPIYDCFLFGEHIYD